MSTITQRAEAHRLILESLSAIPATRYGRDADGWANVVVKALDDIYLTELRRAATDEAKRRAELRASEPKPPRMATCAHCGERFEAYRPDQRYCSPAHRQASYRRRLVTA